VVREKVVDFAVWERASRYREVGIGEFVCYPSWFWEDYLMYFAEFLQVEPRSG